MAAEPVVFVVDDDESVRRSLRWLVESVGLRVECFAGAKEFLDAYEPTMPGCLVLDVRMQGASGLELQQDLNSRDIHIPIIIITGHGDVPMAVRAMKAGAMDFIEKPLNYQTLLDRIHAALAVDAERRRHHLLAETIRERMATLSPRETEVMHRVVAGKLNKEVAAELNISSKTVEMHRAHMMKKMKVGSLAELVRMAMIAKEK